MRALTAALARAARTHVVRPGFIIREVAGGIRRNLGSAIALIVTTTLALTLLGGALILAQEIDHLKGAWYDTTQVTAYLARDATAEQIAALGKRLADDPLVDQVYFEDRDLAYENFTEQFADQPDLLAEISPDQLPQSYRIDLVSPDQGAALVAALDGTPGVRQVIDEHAQLATLFDLLTTLTRAALLLAAVQTFVTAVLLAALVRSSVLLRAQQYTIGRAMGATRTQLATPFLIEVTTYGLISVGGAVGVLALVKVELVDQHLVDTNILSGVIGNVGWDALWSTVGWLTGAGVTLPVLIAATLLIRRLTR